MDGWQQARKYIEWASRQGMSANTMSIIPNWLAFGLNEQEKEILTNLINQTNKEQ